MIKKSLEPLDNYYVSAKNLSNFKKFKINVVCKLINALNLNDVIFCNIDKVLEDNADNQTDNHLNSYCKLITDDESIVYQCKSTDNILHTYSYLIKALKAELKLSDKDYLNYIEPIISYFVRAFSIAPASQCGHDCHSGGLFKHSLLCCYYLIKAFNSDPKQFVDFKTPRLNENSLDCFDKGSSSLYNFGVNSHSSKRISTTASTRGTATASSEASAAVAATAFVSSVPPVPPKETEPATSPASSVSPAATTSASTPKPTATSATSSSRLVKLKATLVLAGFLHDAGKLNTDVTIKTLGCKYQFNQSSTFTLADFIETYKATYLRFYFTKARKNKHENSIKTWLNYFSKARSALLKELIDKSPDSLFYKLVNLSKGSPLYPFIKAADGMAVATSIERFSGFSSIASHLQTALASGYLSLSEDGFYQVKNGVIVQAGSKAFEKMIYLYDKFYEELEVSKRFNQENFFEKLLSYAKKEQYLYLNHDKDKVFKSKADAKSFALNKAPTFSYATDDKDGIPDTEYFGVHNLFTDYSLTELIKFEEHYFPRRQPFFQEMSQQFFFLQVARRTPYLWYELEKDNRHFLVQGIYLPFFEGSNHDYRIHNQIHVSKVRKLFKQLELYDTGRDITYVEFNYPYTGNDISFKEKEKLSQLVKLDSLQFNDFKIKRNLETIDKGKRKLKYQRFLAKLNKQLSDKLTKL
ncbi:MAG: TraI domain-containing protein [Succinivibrio sp.]|nr:TraI domain-containing protein [Succinivibrio sp.]